MFDECGPSVFLEVCVRLVDLQCTGHLLAWAYEFAHHQPLTLVQLVTDTSSSLPQPPTPHSPDQNLPSQSLTLPSLISFVNTQAAFYECFPGHRTVGRMVPHSVGPDR